MASGDWLPSLDGSWGDMGGSPLLRKSPEDQQNASPPSNEDSLKQGQGLIST